MVHIITPVLQILYLTQVCIIVVLMQILTVLAFLSLRKMEPLGSNLEPLTTL